MFPPMAKAKKKIAKKAAVKKKSAPARKQATPARKKAAVKKVAKKAVAKKRPAVKKAVSKKVVAKKRPAAKKAVVRKAITATAVAPIAAKVEEKQIAAPVVETPKPKSRKKTTGNPELAEKIRAWGKKRRMPKDPYLMGIADAIENDEDLEVWASTDVLAIFPHAFIKAAETRLYSMLVLLRNILVFVPVALTWLAISKATVAFALYTAKSTGSVANFLQFWEDGYGYLDKKWTISEVALLDFWIIAAVIALTLITPIMAHNAEDRAEKEELDAERERIGLAVEVMAYLFDKREVNNVTMNSALARSVANLRTSSKSLNDAAKRIEKISKTLPNNANIIQEIRKIGK